MEWPIVLGLIFIGLIVLMLTGLPVAISFMAVNVVGIFVFWGGEAGLGQLLLSMKNSVKSFVLLPFPLFILLGEVLFRSGMAGRAIDVVDTWLGGVPGRLGLLGVGAGVVSSTLSGSGVASTAMLSATLVPDMEARGYKKAMSLGPILGSGRCFAHCPKIEVDLSELSQRLRGTAYQGLDIGVYRSVHASRAGGALPEASFQGGGTASGIMAFALDSGMIEAAVLTDRDGLHPFPRITTKREEVLACASSKFTAAPTPAALNRAVRSGYRRLGVVGTPCQMTAVAQMKGNYTSKKDFHDPVALSVGLFCNWALDPRGLKQLLSTRVDLAGVTGMDIPPPPADVLVVKMGTETLEIPLDEIRPLIPETCSFCPDLTSEWADLSVGMFEGKPGWNTLIARTAEAEDLIREAENAGYLVIEPMPEKNLEHLAGAGRAKKERAFSKAVPKGTVNGREKTSMLRIPPEALERFTSAPGCGAVH